MRKTVVFMAILGCSLLTSTALAKGGDNEPSGYFKLTAEQIKWNNEAVEAQKQGDYAKAQHLMESVILLGETDVNWMQLGRLYDLQGKCLLAEDAYKHVIDAPSTVDIPHETVLKKLIEYQNQHQQTCTANLVLECKAPNLTITIDEDKTLPCTSEPLKITPGEHTIYAQTNYGKKTLNVYLLPNKTLISTVNVVDYEKLAYESGTIHTFDELEQLQATSRNYKIAGWTLLGSGALMAITGGIVYGVAHNNIGNKEKSIYKKYPSCNNNNISSKECTDPRTEINNERNNANKKYKASYALIGIGSAAAITGSVLLIVDAFKHNNLNSNYTTELQITPYFGTNQAGIGMTYSF